MRVIIFGLSYLYFLVLLELSKQDLLALDALRLRLCMGGDIHVDADDTNLLHDTLIRRCVVLQVYYVSYLTVSYSPGYTDTC